MNRVVPFRHGGINALPALLFLQVLRELADRQRLPVDDNREHDDRGVKNHHDDFQHVDRHGCRNRPVRSSARGARNA